MEDKYVSMSHNKRVQTSDTNQEEHAGSLNDRRKVRLPDMAVLFPKFTSRNSVSSAKAEHHPPRDPFTVLLRRAW